MYILTIPNPDPTAEFFCCKLANNINKDHPDCAKVLKTENGYFVAITAHYYNACKLYVQNYCRIKKDA